jgi:hypothetical protein
LFKHRYSDDIYLREVWYITFINSNILKKKTPCFKTLQTWNKVTLTQIIFLHKCGHEKKKKMQPIDQTLKSWSLNLRFQSATETAAIQHTQYKTLWNNQIFNLNKSPTRCNNFPVYYSDVYLQLNVFWAFSHPSSGAQWLQKQPLVLPSYHCDSCAVFVVGPVGPTTNTARLSPQYEGKTRGCCCSHWAPDDRRENALNMLSCK